MRKWRVGTISMGASLVLLGILLFMTQFKGWDITALFLSWWPFILIILGVEVLVYLFLSKQENTFIKYDFLSILFIGALGTVALSFMFLSMSGIMKEMQHTVFAEEKTFDLPTYHETLPHDVERIVLETQDPSIRLEGTTSNAIQAFGTYRANYMDEDHKLLSNIEDYMTVHKTNNTMYISIKQLPEKHGFFPERTRADIVLLIPVTIQLEVRDAGGYSGLTIRPGQLQANWFIQDVDHVTLHLEENSNITVDAHMTEMIFNEKNGTEEEKIEEKRWVTGDGSNNIQITSSHENSVEVFIRGKKVRAE